MTAARDVLVVIDDMLDHIEYVRAKVEGLKPVEFQADRDFDKALNDRWKSFQKQAEVCRLN